jgi:hypothetical protein
MEIVLFAVVTLLVGASKVLFTKASTMDRMAGKAIRKPVALSALIPLHQPLH